MSNPKISKEVIKAFQPARMVEKARLVSYKLAQKVPYVKEHKSKVAKKGIS